MKATGSRTEMPPGLHTSYQARWASSRKSLDVQAQKLLTRVSSAVVSGNLGTSRLTTSSFIRIGKAAHPRPHRLPKRLAKSIHGVLDDTYTFHATSRLYGRLRHHFVPVTPHRRAEVEFSFQAHSPYCKARSSRSGDPSTCDSQPQRRTTFSTQSDSSTTSQQMKERGHLGMMVSEEYSAPRSSKFLNRVSSHICGGYSAPPHALSII